MASKSTTTKSRKPSRSKLEDIKEESQQLRGTVGDVLEEDSDHFEEADKQLLKFHGTYQQEDRDARKNREKTGIRKHYQFMVRCKIPGGRLTAEQYLAVDELAEKYANGTLRFTSRQGIQLHGVLKTNLHDTIAGINECLLTTLGACGDVNRNVMCSPVPNYDSEIHQEMQQAASDVAAHLAPRTTAYHDIWLNGELVDGNGEKKKPVKREPIYGKVYLPRKFKVGFCLPEDNCVDIYTQDLGFLAVVKDDKILGYNVLCGGGSGMSHGNKKTFPAMGKPMCFVKPEQVVEMSEAVVKLFRDHGNREDRKQARLKYVVQKWGVKKFREVLTDYFGEKLKMPKKVAVTGYETHLGWNPQGDDKYFYGVSVENGRVKDEGDLQLRTALRKIMEEYQPELRITPVQDILLCNLPKQAHKGIRDILTEHGVTLPNKVSNVRRLSLACPAIPTCGLAIAEAERALPEILDELETHIKKLGLSKQEISIRMTGCPNGCVRPYQSDIGLVGRSGTKYTVFLGGNVLGDRLNEQFMDLVPREEVVPILVTLLKQYKKDREENEGFGDYCHRVGMEELLQFVKPEESE